MKTLKILPFIALVMMSNISSAQKLAAENTLEISGKSSRGYLGNVIADDTKQQLDLVFITKTKKKLIKFEVYQFDYDLKLINKFSDEQEVKSAREKYKWFDAPDPDKDVTIFNGVTAGAVGVGNLMFTKKEITRKYNWYTGKYKNDIKILEKIKPKTEDGKKYAFFGKFDISETGEVLAIVGEKVKGMDYDKLYHPWMNVKIMKANYNMDITIPGEITFKHPQTMLFQGLIKDATDEEEDASLNDIVCIFGPSDKTSKVQDPNPTNYTYVRIKRDGTIKERINFETKCAEWTINSVYEKDGNVIIYGPGSTLNKPKDAYLPPMVFLPKEKGFDNFQIAGIKDGKMLFVNAVSLEEFETKNAKPDNQKKPVLYTGGRIKINGLDFTSDGSMLLNAQEFSVYGGVEYHDFLMFHFDKNGNLVKSYGIDNAQKGGLKGAIDANTDPKIYPTKSIMFEGTDKKTVYWMQKFISNVEKRSTSQDYGNTRYTTTWYTPRTQIRIGKVDTENGKVGNFITFGDGAAGGKKFYLLDEFPSVKINGGKQIIFLGEDTNRWGMDSSGDYLWLGKFDPTKL